MRAVTLTAVLSLLPSVALCCPWDYETLRAESGSLPCLAPVALGQFPKHTPEYLRAKVRAAELMRAWVPNWLEALDAQAIALIHLRQLDQARLVLEKRTAIAPDAYETHANWGTLETFAGNLDAALEHVKKARAVNPDAHFGRERYHQQLVEYLLRVKASPAALEKDFLGLSLTPEQRLKGAPLASVGVADDAVDAVVSMVSIYGAGDVSHLYVALGNLMALQGHRRLAWAAYARAVALKHPRADELKQWQAALEEAIKRAYVPNPQFGDVFAGMERSLEKESAKYAERAAAYATWERAQLKLGLPFWTSAGRELVFWKQEQLGLRCEAKGPPVPAEERGSVSPATATLEAAAALAEGGDQRCDRLAGTLAQFVTEQREGLLKARTHTAADLPRVRWQLERLTAAMLPCPREMAKVTAALAALTPP